MMRWILVVCFLQRFASGSILTGEDCRQTARLFATIESSSASGSLAQPAADESQLLYHDPSLLICGESSLSCCSSSMEQTYVHQAQQEFYTVLTDTTQYLRSVLTNTGMQYQNDFMSLIDLSANRTEELFREVYKISHRLSKGPLEVLFMDLEGFINHRQVNIHETLSQFFDELFPLVFHNIMNDASAVELSEDYHECLTEIRQELYPRPFGDVPNRLAHQLSKSLVASKIFLSSLSLGIDAMNTTENLVLEESCLHALTRMRYCSHCQGHTTAQPCRNLCYNIMRGCLATVAEVDRHWNGLVDSVRVMGATLKGYYGVSSVLKHLHSRISEAILHAMETGHKFYAQVVERCGHPRKLPSGEPDADATPSPLVQNTHKLDTSTVHLADTDVDIESHVDSVVHNLLASKGFYHSLADTMCIADQYSTGMDQEHCWNGHTIGRYNESLVEVDLETQMRSNPEVEVGASQSSSITALIDKLIHMKKMISSKVAMEMLQSDDIYYGSVQKRRGNKRERTYDGYGSGYGYTEQYNGYNGNKGGRNKGGRGNRNRGGYYYDDEDYDDSYVVYSGSGSGQGPWDSYKIERKKPQNKPDLNSDTDIYMDENPNPTPPSSSNKHNPYESSNRVESVQDPNAAAAMSSHMIMVVCSILCSAIWLNG